MCGRCSCAAAELVIVGSRECLCQVDEPEAANNKYCIGITSGLGCLVCRHWLTARFLRQISRRESRTSHDCSLHQNNQVDVIAVERRLIEGILQLG